MRVSRWIGVAAVALSALWFSGSAQAQGSGWSGLYLGAHAGWARSAGDGVNFSGTAESGVGNFNRIRAIQTGAVAGRLAEDGDGLIAGGQIGYNWQSGALVYGLEADLSWLGQSASGVLGPTAVAGWAPYTTTASTDISWLGTVRGRLGYDLNRTMLLYVTGGLAYGHAGFEAAITNLPLANTTVLSSSGVRAGWTVGGGLDVAISRNLSVRAEYLYFDLGSETITAAYTPNAGSSFSARADYDGHIIRAGLNYKLGN